MDINRSNVFVALKDDVDSRLVDALRRLAGVDVSVGAPQNAVLTPTATTAVVPGSSTLEDLDVQTAGTRPPLLMIEGVLDRAAAARLEDRGVGFVDRAGRWWLPGLPKSTTASHPEPRHPRTMRAPQIRMAQLVADHPEQEWTERGLAERGHSTQQTAHRLMTSLEGQGYLERIGAGRTSRRRMVDTRGLRAWLARVATPPRGGLLRCYVPDPHDLTDLHVPLALTGAAAAAAIGRPVLTGNTPPIYRARTTQAVLEEIPAEVGGFRTDQGHNLALLADVDDLAHLDARQLPDGRLIAPPSRILLDLSFAPRGKAAMDVFLDIWPSEPRS
jgi:hypothetical protein